MSHSVSDEATKPHRYGLIFNFLVESDTQKSLDDGVARDEGREVLRLEAVFIMSSNLRDFPIDDIGDFGYELIEEGEIEDASHDLPPPGPFLPLGKGHPLTQKSHLVLDEPLLLDVVLLLLEELLQECGVGDEEEALVEGVEDEETGIGVIVEGVFGVVVLVSSLTEGLFCVLERAEERYKGNPDGAIVASVTQHS